jgi:hypothetical protein
VSLTSHISNAEHSYAALLDHTALVGEERDSSRCRPRWTATIGEVVAGVWARLVGSLLEAVSDMLVEAGPHGQQAAIRTEAMGSEAEVLAKRPGVVLRRGGVRWRCRELCPGVGVKARIIGTSLIRRWRWAALCCSVVAPAFCKQVGPRTHASSAF